MIKYRSQYSEEHICSVGMAYDIVKRYLNNNSGITNDKLAYMNKRFTGIRFYVDKGFVVHELLNKEEKK